jgi:hypothetical protein
VWCVCACEPVCVECVWCVRLRVWCVLVVCVLFAVCICACVCVVRVCVVCNCGV